MLSEGNQSILISEVSEGDQSMLISEGDQSMLILEGDQSMLISEGDQSLSDLISEISLNEDIFENILEPETIAKSEANVYYPNKAYADLMTLITKYKLSNATGNAIIKFFNKHANLSTVNPQPSPDNPQQESAVTAAAAWDELTWTAEDQFLFQRPETESRDSDAIQTIDNPCETEDLGRTWEDLMGISEDIPENTGLME